MAIKNAKFNFGKKNNNFMTFSTEIFRAIENIQKDFFRNYGRPKNTAFFTTVVKMEVRKI